MPSAVRSRQPEIVKKLQEATARIDEQGRQLAAMQREAGDKRATCYVKNNNSDVVHALRTGDAAHTACGWSVGPVQQRKLCIEWLTSITRTSWKDMCERCMVPERNAARLLRPLEVAESDTD